MDSRNPHSMIESILIQAHMKTFSVDVTKAQGWSPWSAGSKFTLAHPSNTHRRFPFPFPSEMFYGLFQLLGPILWPLPLTLAILPSPITLRKQQAQRNSLNFCLLPISSHPRGLTHPRLHIYCFIFSHLSTPFLHVFFLLNTSNI